MKTVAVSALGCKVNQYEAQAMREQFARAGYRLVGRDAAADVYVINTCTVTGSADAKSRRLIRNALRANPAARVVVTGCYAELDRREIEALSPHLVVVGNEEKNGIAQLLAPKGASVLPSGAGRITAFSGRARAFVKVQDGCDNFCSYCKVPLARGRSRSRPSDEITAEIRTLVANGYKEIVLTGICLGDWGRDLGVAFELLLHESAAAAGGARIRLSSIEPWYVTDAILR
ncbi:MAG: radical SAM protein, partial [Candidatus Omnitrophota bacterium]